MNNAKTASTCFQTAVAAILKAGGSGERLLLCTPRRFCGKMAREYIKLQQSLLFGHFEQLQGFEVLAWYLRSLHFPF